MKQSIFFLSIIIFCALAFNGQAQNKENSGVEIFGILYSQPHGLEGSPYLFNDWSTGNIIMYNSQEATNVKLKYNILDNELIYYNDRHRRLFTVDRNTIISFTLKPGSTDSMYFEKYDGEEIGYRIRKNDFVHVMYNGKIKFLARHTAEISEANDISSKDKIFPKNIYFIETPNGTNEIKLNLRSVQKTFPHQKQEIKKLATQVRFRKKSELSMTKLIEQIDISNITE